MVDWTDNAVRATVFVAILNIGLLTAVGLKDDAETAMKYTNGQDQTIDAVIESLHVDSSLDSYLTNDPNCMSLLDWRILTEDNPSLSLGLISKNLAKPCAQTGARFKDVDTPIGLALTAGVDVALVERNGSVSLTCFREKMNLMGSTGGFDRPNLTEELLKRNELSQHVRRLCEIEALLPKQDDLKGGDL